MCAIFGYIARGKSTISSETLAAIVRGNVNRGPHAFGFAWIDQAGRLHCFKQCGRLTDHLGVLSMARGARMLVGHLRWATHGRPEENINNHPHPADGGWIVHNGVLRNYEQLVHEHDLCPVSACDSEALGLLIERSTADSLLRRCGQAVESAEGSLCMMGLWSRPGSLVVARRGNPLAVSDTPEGVYLATLPRGLPGRKVSMIADDSIRVFSRREGAINVRRMDLEPTATVGSLFDEDGNYAGG